MLGGKLYHPCAVQQAQAARKIAADRPLAACVTDSHPAHPAGISHEYPYVEELSVIPSYVAAIRLLQSYGSGPLSVRVGGGSTDFQTVVTPEFVLKSLQKLHELTGAEFILGLNLEAGDLELTRDQMAAAEEHIDADAITSFEIGNEVRPAGAGAGDRGRRGDYGRSGRSMHGTAGTGRRERCMIVVMVTECCAKAARGLQLRVTHAPATHPCPQASTLHQPTRRPTFSPTTTPTRTARAGTTT